MNPTVNAATDPTEIARVQAGAQATIVGYTSPPADYYAARRSELAELFGAHALEPLLVAAAYDEEGSLVGGAVVETPNLARVADLVSSQSRHAWALSHRVLAALFRRGARAVADPSV